MAQVGDKIKYASRQTAIPPAIVPGNSGANQVWNFFSITPEYLDSMQFTNPFWTQYGNFFPGANLASKWDTLSTYLDYYLNDTSAFYILGSAGDLYQTGINCSMNYIPKYKYMDWPAYYGNIFSSSSLAYLYTYTGMGPSGPDSIMQRAHRSSVVDIDAWGTMNIPLGSFICLRAKKTDTEIDTIWYYYDSIGWDTPFVYSGTATYYEWWTNAASVRFPLVTLSVDQAGQTSSIAWVYSFTSTSGIEESTQKNEIIVYPNPVQDIIFIESKYLGTLELSDISGKILRTWQQKSLSEVIDVSDLKNGIYFLKIMVEKNRFSSTVKKIIVAR